MRIIAGTKRGMNLFSPPTCESRPITDRVKESLFNILWNYGFPENKIVADLFCGVGSLGLESLSRGAEFVTFVEKNPKIVAVLKRNIEKAGFIRESKVITADVFKIGAPLASAKRGEAGLDSVKKKYDLVFVDPPYAAITITEKGSTLAALLDILAGQLAPAGFAVVRTSKHVQLMDSYGPLHLIERRDWGTMAISILQTQNR
jgi:16S rRNA (guanine(966)-N(2))-methyltransferase RsmD